MSKLFQDISDTAKWVAQYRAMESQREDAIFNDPFAERLAGIRGKEIVDLLPAGLSSSWSLAVRTVSIDEMLLNCIAKNNITHVVNLAAGLDSRAFRLTFPHQITWTEVDLPEILDYKMEVLKNDVPKCKLQSWRYDLSKHDQRKEMYDKINQFDGDTLVLTEGLLCYLEEQNVSEMSEELFANKNVRFWLFDLFVPLSLKMLNKHWKVFFDEEGAHFRFATSLDFFTRIGWKPSDARSVISEAERLNRTSIISEGIKLIFESKNMDSNDFYRMELLEK